MRKVFVESRKQYRNHGIDWKSLVGQEVKFIYDEITGYIKIQSYSKGRLFITYKEFDFQIGVNSFRCCKLGKILHNIFIVNPYLASLIIDDYCLIKNLSMGSEKIVNVRCPECGSIRRMKIKQLYRYGVCCYKCGDGRSYPEKYMYSVLDQLKINFLCEHIFDFAKSYKFDFYIPIYNLVIETDGLQHDDPKGKWSVNNDLEKNEALRRHGVNLIRIDAKISEGEYIKRSILNSNLTNIFNLDNIDWEECNKDAISSLVCKVAQTYNIETTDLDIIADKFHLSRRTVRLYLYKAEEIGLCKNVKRDLRARQYDNCAKAQRSKHKRKIKVLYNGDVEKTYDSLYELCENSYKDFGVRFDKSHVCDIANHKYGRKSYFGYTFEYAS